MFKATIYRNKPAVLDTVSRVYYFGYKNMEAAQAHAKELNA